MDTQGYEVKYNIVYQDNNIPMLLANNGNSSNIDRAKNINTR